MCQELWYQHVYFEYKNFLRNIWNQEYDMKLQIFSIEYSFENTIFIKVALGINQQFSILDYSWPTLKQIFIITYNSYNLIFDISVLFL